MYIPENRLPVTGSRFFVCGFLCAKVCLAHLIVMQQRARVAGHGDAPVFEHVGTVGDGQRHFRVLLHEQDRDAALVHGPDDIKDLLDQHGGQTHRRLVHDDELRRAHDGATHGDHLLLAAGECARKLLCAFLQAREALIHVLQIRFNYYSLFASAKKNDVTFEYIIRELYRLTGNVEASFSSKMLATIDASKPVWDKYVLQNLGLELTGKTPNEKLDNAVALYRQIERWYSEYLGTFESRDNIDTFNRMLPDYKWVSDVKKIDCLLWSMRE